LATVGVPPVKVGLLEYAKYANYELQNRAFYQDTIQPKAKKIEGAINTFLCPLFDRGNEQHVFEFDFRRVIGESALDLAVRFTRLFEMGATTPNEVRDALSLGERYEGGDQFYVSSKFRPITSMDELVSEEQQAVEEDLEQAKSEFRAAIQSGALLFEPDQVPESVLARMGMDRETFRTLLQEVGRVGAVQE
jgi:hypothetical protein